MGLPESLQAIPGDAESVFDASARFTALAESLEETRGTLGGKTDGAVESLDGPRAETFAEAAGTISTRLEATATQLSIAGLALNDYGTVLASAQTAVDDFGGEWQDKQDTIDELKDSDDPDDAETVSDARSRQSTLESDGDDARSELNTAADTAASSLDEATEILIPDASGKSPATILEESLGSWANIVLDGQSANDFYTDFKQWTDPLLASQSAIGGAAGLNTAVSILKNWNVPHEASLLLEQTKTLEEAKIAAALKVSGDAGDYRVLRQFFEAEEVISKARAGSEAADAAMAGRLSRLSQGVMLTSKFAKFTGVLSVVSGAYDIVNPSHEGWRGYGDRAAGALAVGGGGAAILATAGLITLGPIGGAIAVGAMAVAGVWTLGNLVYDNWDNITGAVSDATDWCGDRLNDAKDWAGDRMDDLAESNLNPGNWF